MLLRALPPLSEHFGSWRRRLKAERLEAYLCELSRRDELSSLWRAIVSSRVCEGHRLELGYCPNRRLGWLDIFTTAGQAPLLMMPLSASPRSHTTSGGSGTVVGKDASARGAS